MAAEVVAHLTGLPGAEAEVVLDIRVPVPGGAPDSAARTGSENAYTLKFNTADFEAE